MPSAPRIGSFALYASGLIVAPHGTTLPNIDDAASCHCSVGGRIYYIIIAVPERSGTTNGQVYLCSPTTAAATALRGDE